MYKNSLEIQTTWALIPRKLLNAAQQNISEVQLGWDAGVAPANTEVQWCTKNSELWNAAPQEFDITDVNSL